MAAYHQGRSGAAVEGRLQGIVADARPLAQLAVARRLPEADVDAPAHAVTAVHLAAVEGEVVERQPQW